MEIKKYKLINNVSGWIIFVIAATVYLMTIEPTASFWDCSEFITSAYKLEVGHPPGAPIFMLIGNIVSHFAPNPSKVALVLNSLSAIFSALVILFLFWSITHFVRKIILNNHLKNINLTQLITILGAGTTGALAYTFSDTFWFSAVEGEVYAFSSFITAITFWLILKWETIADESNSNQLLILIAYLTGMSIAIHLLNLLCIPCVVLVYFFRKTTKPTWGKTIVALIISFGIIAIILYSLIPGLLDVCGWVELFFVNILQLPYNSGVIFYLIILFSTLFWSVWETMDNSKNLQKGKIVFIISIVLLGIPFISNSLGLNIFIIIAMSFFIFLSKKINLITLNTILTSLLVITIGYSSYALVVIRAISNTPMNQNSPNNIFALKSYLTREQYGETPLVYGQTFASELKYKRKGNILEAEMKDNGAIWSQIFKKYPSEKDRYYISGRRKTYVYLSKLCTLFPRMYSSSQQHIQGYKEWSNFKGTRVKIFSPQGIKWVLNPTFSENIKYFLRYQCNFMYLRYFLWNFCGKQNDIQGYGEISNGNWITGIKFLDQLRLGPQNNMPDSITKNKGHNKFYMLPLLLGIIGIIFQIHFKNEGIKQFWIIFALFFMTGLAIAIYLNQTPFQPRERDYAYVGSFYAFCIWIGIGTAGIINCLKHIKVPKTVSTVFGTFICLLIPIQMGSQTWDDHDRSNRFIVRDFAMNYLSACEKNAIIFTNGDNDTFPLWYIQEVEGFRRDIRVCNLSYLQTDWYIDQMKQHSYESKPLPIEWKKYEYTQGKHDIVYIFNEQKSPITIKEALRRIRSENIKDKFIAQYNLELDNIPTYKIIIPIDSVAVIKSGIIKYKNATWIPHNLFINFESPQNVTNKNIDKKYLTKDEIMILEILKNNINWSRPIYYAATVNSDKYLQLFPYLRCDGIIYRVVPFKASRYQPIDTNIMYNIIMNKYRWGNLEHPNLYLDENTIRMVRIFRTIFGQLAMKLAEEHDFKRAKKVLDKCLKVIPSYNVPYDYPSTYLLADAYYRIGNIKKANKIYTLLAKTLLKNLKWYNSLNDDQYISVIEDIKKDIIFLQYTMNFFSKQNSKIEKNYYPDFLVIANRFKEIVENKNQH